MKKQVLVYNGDEFQKLALGKYRKDVLHVGSWKHPTTGQEVKVTQERLNNLFQWTEKYRKNVDKEIIRSRTVIPSRPPRTWAIASASSSKARSYMPSCSRVARMSREARLEEDPQRLAPHRVQRQGLARQRLPRGHHPCRGATRIPVVTGQEDFVKLSAKDEAFDFFIPQAIALSMGGSDVLKTHDQLRKDLAARMDEHKASHKLNGPDHEDTRKAAGRLQDAAHRLHRQADVIRMHVNNSTGGPPISANTPRACRPRDFWRIPSCPRSWRSPSGCPRTPPPNRSRPRP